MRGYIVDRNRVKKIEELDVIEGEDGDEHFYWYPNSAEEEFHHPRQFRPDECFRTMVEAEVRVRVVGAAEADELVWNIKRDESRLKFLREMGYEGEVQEGQQDPV